MADFGVKALLFDVFGTVVDWRESVAREARAALEPLGASADWRAFADAWRGKYQPAMERVRSGARGFVRLDVLHRENLLEVLDEFGIAGLDEAGVDRLNRAWHRLDGWPDSAPGLARLKTRFVVGAMSNGNVALMVNMAKYAGLPWDVILGAEPARAYKPDPATYLTGADWLGIEPGEAMMCAAHANDLRAAAACGLRTAFIARPLEHGPDGPAETPAEGEFDLAVGGIEELADRLGC